MLEMRIHGFGGQGAVTMAHLIAISALGAGKVSQALPFFGTERRGSAVKACVRVSDTEIKVRSQSLQPDLLILMSEKLLDLAISEGIKDGGKMIVNTHQPQALPYPYWYLDAESIAHANDLVVAGVPFINIPILGAVCKVIGIPAEVMADALRQRWQGELGEKNVRAAMAGYEQVQEFQG